jgi:hypothetical protein
MAGAAKLADCQLSEATARPRGFGILAAYAVILAAFMFSALILAAYRPLWMDEVLSVIPASLPTVADTIRAVWNGAEFSPPTYDLLLRAVLGIAPGLPVNLAVRLPSIIAALLAAWCVAQVLKRHLRPLPVLVAFGLTLAMGLFDYVFQARQYALLAMLQIAALWLWKEVDVGERRWVRPVGLWCVLALGVSLHFYGVIAVSVIAVAEAALFIRRRQLRLAVIVPLLATLPILTAWAPFAAHLSVLNSADVAGAAYYGRVGPTPLTEAIREIALGNSVGMMLLFGVALIVAAVTWLGPKDPAPAIERSELLQIVVLALLAIIPMTFIFSAFVTHTFRPHYAIGAVFLAPIAVAMLLDRIPQSRLACLLVIPCIVLGLAWNVIVATNHFPGAPPQIEAAARGSNVPVVISEGRLFLEMWQAASPGLRARMVYLRLPDGAFRADPTNDNQVKIMAGIAHGIDIVPVDEFLGANRRFYVVTAYEGLRSPLLTTLAARCALGPLALRTDELEMLRAGTGATYQGCVPALP